MSERTCGNCRWYDGNVVSGACRRRAPQAAFDTIIDDHSVEWPTVFPEESCGEWADKTITPEEEERRELVRRFAVAIVGARLAERFVSEDIWYMAEGLADAEPKFDSGKPSA